jgi:Uma2 family endonuclease
MPTAIAISVEEYLNTTYRPDCDYVGGEVLERNLGEIDHSDLQALLTTWLMNHRKEWGICVFPEQRVQVKASRFRVPDISVVLGRKPTTPVLESPPLLCIEILSRDDRMERIQERIDDYLAFGVPCVWVVNPRTRRGFVYTSEGMREAKDGILRVADSPITVPLAELE